MIVLPVAALLAAAHPVQAATFADLAAATSTSSETAQIVALDEQLSRAAVGSSVSRMLPSVSLSDNLTWTWLNTDRFPQPGESLEDCEERLGRVCEQLLAMAGSFTIPGETVNHSLSLMGTQTLWSARAMMGIAQARTRQELSDTYGEMQLDRAAGELVQAYVELQAAVETLRLTREALAVAEQDLAATRTAHSVGDATDLDVDLAVFEVEKMRVDLAQAEREVPRMLSKLWDTAGTHTESTQRVCPMMEVADRGGPMDLDGASSLELSRQQAELDRQDLTLSRLSYLPSVTAIGGVSFAGRGEDLAASFDDFGQNSWYVGGTASWTLFSGGSRVLDNRSSAWSVQKSELELAQDYRDLALSDADHAARLRDLAEGLDLQRRELDLQRRRLAATESSYHDGGHAPLDQVLQTRRAITKLEQQIVATHKQQVLTLTRRMIDAGKAADLLAALTASDRSHAAAGRCTELSR